MYDEVNNGEEELPHAGGDLVLVVEYFCEAVDAFFDGLVAQLGEGGFNWTFQQLFDLGIQMLIVPTRDRLEHTAYSSHQTL